MAGFETVRVAAVQATPVLLDAEATIDKAVALFEDAVDGGASLVVFPECFVSIYPSGAWAAPAATWTDGCDELWERMWASSVDVDGPLVDRLLQACARTGAHLAIGINEREDARPGTLYNTLVVVGPGGVLHRHRKLMPTMQERVFHGVGAGDDLGVVDLSGVARVGGLICWENRMPLARWRVYEGGPQIWLAPTADDSETWLVSMRHIAIEAGAFVVSVPQHIPASAFPADFPLPLPDGVDVFGRGGACVVAPSGAPRQALLRRGRPLRPRRRPRARPTDRLIRPSLRRRRPVHGLPRLVPGVAHGLPGHVPAPRHRRRDAQEVARADHTGPLDRTGRPAVDPDGPGDEGVE
jgi:predicted amidohydrolase